MMHHEPMVAHDRQAALLREAAARRMTKHTRVSRPRHTLAHSRLLDHIGARLVAWGWRLRSRYGNLEGVEYRRSEA